MTATTLPQVRRLLSVASAASAMLKATTPRVPVRVHLVKGMPVLASGLARIRPNEPLATPNIDPRGSGFQMVGIDTPPMKARATGAGRVGVVADVIEAEAIRDGAAQALVDGAVRLFLSPAAMCGEPSIPVVIHAVKPMPAPVVLNLPFRANVAVLVPVDEPSRHPSNQALLSLCSADQRRFSATSALAEAERDIIRLHRTNLRCQTPAVSAARGHFASSNYTLSLRVEAA